jgi:hypothetical protein
LQDHLLQFQQLLQLFLNILEFVLFVDLIQPRTSPSRQKG